MAGQLLMAGKLHMAGILHIASHSRQAYHMAGLLLMAGILHMVGLMFKAGLLHMADTLLLVGLLLMASQWTCHEQYNSCLLNAVGPPYVVCLPYVIGLPCATAHDRPTHTARTISGGPTGIILLYYRIFTILIYFENTRWNTK